MAYTKQVMNQIICIVFKVRPLYSDKYGGGVVRFDNLTLKKEKKNIENYKIRAALSSYSDR